jgi:Domain of unknown function (DUF222)
MACGDAQQAVEAFDDLEAAFEKVAALPFDAYTTPEQFNFLDRLERLARRWPTVGHRLLNLIGEQATPAEIGGRLSHVLADRLRITRAEAARRIADAQVLGPRTSLTGQPLQPLWCATAAAQAAGAIGAGHLGEIRWFFKQLPDWVDAPTTEQAERDLAKYAADLRPDQLHRAAIALADSINPDGHFSDEDRARRRSITIGRQGEDGMSPISGYLTPQARAHLDAVLSKWAAPGMCNPDDQSPIVDGPPGEEAITADHRSPAQRTHDALDAMCRRTLACGELGSHHGLPVSVIVTTTLQDLESAAGKAHTGAGTWLPISDVIRMAGHARHYLAVFDTHTRLPLYLGASKRIATPGQRIVLHATDRGCSAPGCDVPGYLCQVHHVEDWAHSARTDIDNLTFACGPHHRLLGPGGWKTRKRADGTTEWIPPPHLDRGQPRTNNYHHPERYLRDKNDDDDQDAA